MLEFIKNWLERIAKANEREFGRQNPDCCTINQNRPKETPGGKE